MLKKKKKKWHIFTNWLSICCSLKRVDSKRWLFHQYFNSVSIFLHFRHWNTSWHTGGVNKTSHVKHFIIFPMTEPHKQASQCSVITMILIIIIFSITIWLEGSLQCTAGSSGRGSVCVGEWNFIRSVQCLASKPFTANHHGKAITTEAERRSGEEPSVTQYWWCSMCVCLKDSFTSHGLVQTAQFFFDGWIFYSLNTNCDPFSPRPSPPPFLHISSNITTRHVLSSSVLLNTLKIMSGFCFNKHTSYDKPSMLVTSYLDFLKIALWTLGLKRVCLLFFLMSEKIEGGEGRTIYR